MLHKSCHLFPERWDHWVTFAVLPTYKVAHTSTQAHRALTHTDKHSLNQGQIN